MNEVLSVLISLKLAIFLGALILILITDIIYYRKKFVSDIIYLKRQESLLGLNIFVVQFVLISILELIRIFALQSPGVLPFFESYSNIEIVIKLFMLISGIGIIWYFIDIQRNFK